MLEDNIQALAKTLGAKVLAGLHDLARAHPLIGDVRGRGLMCGLELVTDRGTKVPATAQTADVIERCKALGLIIGKGGYFGNVIRITPPMCLTEGDINFLLGVLDVALGESEG